MELGPAHLMLFPVLEGHQRISTKAVVLYAVGARLRRGPIDVQPCDDPAVATHAGFTPVHAARSVDLQDCCAYVVVWARQICAGCVSRSSSTIARAVYAAETIMTEIWRAWTFRTHIAKWDVVVVDHGRTVLKDAA